MKLKLIIPAWPESSIWKNLIFRFPYLSVTTLAALTPDSWDVSFEDENIAPVNFDDDVGLVAITALTPLAPEAYRIAREFRKRGVKVIMGGFHATWMPGEALQYVDSVLIGEAESLWNKVLTDFEAGNLKREYRSDKHSDISGIPVARREILPEKGYFFTNTLQTTRGCPFNCEFCSVTAFYGKTYRTRPLSDVSAELDSIAETSKNHFLFIVDDNITGNPAYARDLFNLLKRYPFKWLSQTSIKFAENPELLRLAKESGCYGMFIGFESLSQEALDRINKRFNRVDKYAELIKRIHDHGIGIQGSFIFGYDWDTRNTFEEVVNFTEKTRLDSVLFTILTPFPGTRIFEEMKQQDRLLTTDWSRYDMAHAVFRPQNMTPEELEEMFVTANRRFYSIPSMFRRLIAKRRSLSVFIPMNWGFRKAWKGFR
ncbi:(Dimethylallyl)adenosine tRNA methylthiotransferase MiaB [bacterium BMS3Abin07]|nr:(Dimethylallyl)adenosine tRNA methylthiotransferase MiaB [bacterium BMS3Abin07]GBE32763.1 (Dimethylallyl)adenosine tRNA methylthiotransferase MiaB [bacterium BMS3Bbin05]HDL19878.1 B12-binding domain-containing radical SAM protein [Nitrospirota bacterium]HDO22386.1 B12-binding domain-containing radical SAM protein [Nitrospirota bacterium]HDZ87824.1 B12-binding domain-containing radical SAM protein [Nitrospirota bacterium]